MGRGHRASHSHTEGGHQSGKPGGQLGQDGPVSCSSGPRGTDQKPLRSVRTAGGRRREGRRGPREVDSWVPPSRGETTVQRGKLTHPRLVRPAGRAGLTFSLGLRTRTQGAPGRRGATSASDPALSPPLGWAAPGCRPSSPRPAISSFSSSNRRAPCSPGTRPLLSFPPRSFSPHVAAHTPPGTLLKHPLLREASSDHLI